MKLQQLRKLIREEVNKEMGKEIESSHYLELLKDLQETNDISDETELNDFYDALIEFAESIKPSKSSVNENEMDGNAYLYFQDIYEMWQDQEILRKLKKGYAEGKYDLKLIRDVSSGRLDPYVMLYGHNPHNLPDEEKDEDYDGDMYAMRSMGAYGRQSRWS